MDANHYNELIDLSQGIYDEAAEKLTNYISARYCAVGNDTADEQLEDYLFVAEETSAGLSGTRSSRPAATANRTDRFRK